MINSKLQVSATLGICTERLANRVNYNQLNYYSKSKTKLGKTRGAKEAVLGKCRAYKHGGLGTQAASSWCI